MGVNTPEHVHFIGIGGYGMSAIAKVLLEMGYYVSGSDEKDQELVQKLAAKGAKVHIGHEASQVTGADLVVYSTAVSKDNVEIQEAEKLNIPVIHRSQMLARLLNDGNGIAVAGAHGKTTTSSMIALVMEICQKDPTFIIGGEIMNIGCNAKAGTGEFVVAEADESDGSFLQYHPTYALVNNIEADHLEYYDGDFQKLKDAYAQFLSQVKEGGKAVVSLDDPYLREMIPQVNSEVITFGIEEEADFRAINIQLGDRKIQFSVLKHGQLLGEVSLNVPGKHNVYNALATIIICLEAGLSFAQIVAALPEFNGAKRRFQVLGEVDDIMIVDDYAHHPTEIEATIAAARATGKKIIAVFQPQRYTRTFFLLHEFSRAFNEADQVIITDIYSPAGEQRIEGINSARLTELIAQNSNSNVLYIPTKEEVQTYLINHVESGDLVLTMGAGDIWRTADGLVKALLERANKPA